jgi:hypothetical protein
MGVPFSIFLSDGFEEFVDTAGFSPFRFRELPLPETLCTFRLFGGGFFFLRPSLALERFATFALPGDFPPIPVGKGRRTAASDQKQGDDRPRQEPFHGISFQR